MAKKVALTLDHPTIRRLEAASERLGKPRSEVVREAIADFDDRTGRLSEKERQRLLKVIRDMVPSIPLQPLSDVEKEIAEIRSARHGGGRRGLSRGF